VPSKMELEDALDHMITDAGKIGSTTIMFLDKDRETLLERGFSEAAEPPTEQYYQLGSVSKFLTALTCLVLNRQGSFALDDPLRTARELTPPYFGQHVSLSPRAILHHFTGLNIRRFPGYRRDEVIPDITHIIDGRGRSPKLAFKEIPLSRVTYSSGAFVLLQIELQRLQRLTTLLPSALQIVSPDVAIFVDELERAVPKSSARGYTHSVIPVPHGSLHYPETCSQGLWARPVDLVKVLRDVARLIRCETEERTLGGVLRNKLFHLGFHPRMAMSVLVDTDAQGRLFYHHQGETAGFTTQFISYPKEDVHVVALTSGAITLPELKILINRGLALSSLGSPSGASVIPGKVMRQEGINERGIFANDCLEVCINPPFATVRTAGGYMLKMSRSPSGDYTVCERPFPRFSVDGDILNFTDGFRKYALTRPTPPQV
jgi:hypothetical protein